MSRQQRPHVPNTEEQKEYAPSKGEQFTYNDQKTYSEDPHSVGGLSGMLGYMTALQQCAYKSSQGGEVWGERRINYNKHSENDNTLSCPGQFTQMPHWTQPGQHPKTTTKPVGSDKFDRMYTQPKTDDKK